MGSSKKRDCKVMLREQHCEVALWVILNGSGKNNAYLLIFFSLCKREAIVLLQYERKTLLSKKKRGFGS